MGIQNNQSQVIGKSNGLVPLGIITTAHQHISHSIERSEIVSGQQASVHQGVISLHQAYRYAGDDDDQAIRRRLLI